MSALLPKTYPVTCHTNYVGENSTYVAVKGFSSDGADYIKEALNKGASQVVVEENVDIDIYAKGFPLVKFIKVGNTRKALAEMSAKALDYPASKLKIIGITGTKGKTTTAFIIDHILSFTGYKTALIGTVKNKIDVQEERSYLTTPPADFIQIFLAECVNRGVTHVVMEVSAHSLSLDRVHEVDFDVACLTNLGQDHMDFYVTMDKYFEDKCKIFSKLRPGGTKVINKDDFYGKKVSGGLKFSQGSDFHITKNTLLGLELSIGNSDISIPSLFGCFNAYNVVMAFFAVKSIGVNVNTIIKALKTFRGIPGRLQRHDLKNGARAFVDFAHNPSSMESVLKSLRVLGEHLIVVFGCGGNKDQTKRPIMGALADKYCDEIIVTDDNPRDEDRFSITSEICAGITSNREVHEISDRDHAIKKAVEISRRGSIIAILGKGHEDYYLVGGQKKYFDDFLEISKY